MDINNPNKYARLTLIEEMRAAVERGEPMASAVICRSEGSTPRKAGARMLLQQGALPLGSVGGGAIEAEVIRGMKAVLASGGMRLLDFKLTSEEAAGSGMVCGGSLTVLVERFDPEEDVRLLLQTLEDRIAGNRRSILATAFTGTDIRARSLLDELGNPVAGSQLDASSLGLVRNPPEACRAPILLCQGESHLFLEPYRPPDRVLIFGAGHIAVHVACLASQVGFGTVVFDDRPEFANRDRFPGVDEVVVLPDFQDAFPGIRPGPGSHVLIVTRGHQHDAEVLRQAIALGFTSIGMIGSLRKRESVHASLEAQGVPKAVLAMVRCPVGLAIGAKTPEEIALSIVAELIQLRAADGQ